MLHNEDHGIRTHRTDGSIGLELESQRTDESGRLARTCHPFPDDRHIVRDFGEAQLEINTSPADGPEAALAELHGILSGVHHKLRERGEVLWPFSNPPVIHSEADIEIAAYPHQHPNYQYRRYLAKKYGKYQMTYSGIHFNYSFSESLLRDNARLEGVERGEDYRRYKDRFYLELAEQVLSHSWVVVALLGASPLADNSFFEAGQSGKTVFSGSASLRSGPQGYWNHFLPLLCYEDMESYTTSIQKYIDWGMISRPSELYYPVRIKSAGAYSLDALRTHGANHIELRMIDLNPFAPEGIDLNDLRFLRLFLVWLASLPREQLDVGGQLRALQNHKSAAGYDWSICRIMTADGGSVLLWDALDGVLGEMETFYAGDPSALAALRSQREKLCDRSKRYACRVRHQFEGNYISSGLRRAAEIQALFHA